MSNDDLEELDLISAVWIIASNDENHLITYEGIRERLGLAADIDVKGLVLKRRELFRPDAPPGELDDWKADMKAGKRLPNWIRMKDGPTREQTIEELTGDGIFRSQFRANRNSSPSQIEIVTWGLEHLDRIRKGRIAVKEASAKSWQMWLVFGVGVANILVSIAMPFFKTSDRIDTAAPTTMHVQPSVAEDAPKAAPEQMPPDREEKTGPPRATTITPTPPLPSPVQGLGKANPQGRGDRGGAQGTKR